ncbi:MAG: hypothetical protein KGL90_06855 [Burkholderiales bacterium]|nr:hypothetical protein [Burkholderiales bacterium]
MNLRTTHIASAALLALVATTAGAQAATASTTEALLLQRLEGLAKELESVKAELHKMQDAQAITAATAQATAATVAANTAAAPTASATELTSYGEINYTRPQKNTPATQTDVARFVLGYQHRFNEQTKVVAELELEHAVSSASDQGEVEVEQAYVEHRLNDRYGLRGGLFLIPLGMLNNNHEPTAFYGVQRNMVETAIIPSTWREAGIQVFGEHDNGVSWSAGLTTGFDLGKWDGTSKEGQQSPLRSIHQEGQLANSKDLSVFGSVDWRGLPGLRLGGGLFTGKVAQGAANFAAPEARLTVLDLHAKWTPGPWDFSAVYANGAITGAGDLNTTLAGSTALVPKSFDGWYLQGAYKFRLGGDYAVAPFGRLERVNTARSFDGIVTSMNLSSYPTEEIVTLGAHINIAPTVVIKTDIRRYKENTDANSFNLGLGFSF